MKKGSVFLALVSGTAFVAVIGNFSLLYLFSSGEIPFTIMLTRFSLPAFLFMAVIAILSKADSKLFNSGDFTKPGEKALYLLKKIGAVPIKTIALIMLLQAIFLSIIIFVFGKTFGVDPGTQAFLYSACLAFGMTMGCLTYVISDGLVTRTLLGHNITAYPNNLREYRQSLKICIVPNAVLLVSVVLTFSVMALSLHKNGMDVSSVRSGGWTVTILVLAAFFIFIIILGINLKKNASFLFHSIITQLENLSAGKKDLKQRINIASVDELGTIAGMMNNFCDNIALSMKEIKVDQQELFESSRQLEHNAQEMYKSVDRISSAIAEAREKAEAGARTLSVDQSSAAIHKIAQNIEALSISIITQSSSVSQASAAIEEMVGNISSIGKVTRKMEEQFGTVNKAANEGIIIQKNSTESVDQIALQSKALQAANYIIATISAQTNLLAMNAAIEAAHAGAAGRGFSVVADEIRKLAETAAEESKKISQELKQISKAIDGVVKDTRSSSAAFSDVSMRAGETESLVREVNNAIKEQQEGADQILTALKSMNEITDEVKTGSNTMRENNNTMLSEIGQLQKQSKDISTGMDNISKEINNINTDAGAVSKLAGAAYTTVEKLKDIVDSFEV